MLFDIVKKLFILSLAEKFLEKAVEKIGERVGDAIGRHHTGCGESPETGPG